MSLELNFVRDIPGFKPILKAILRSQIQHLVEQLSAETDEESILLTVSINDGTLSHLGSDSGKSFIDDHEDIKSQFLGFCLKDRQAKQDERASAEDDYSSSDSPIYRGPIRSSQSGRRIKPTPKARQLATATPMSRSHASGSHRVEPYTLARPGKKRQINESAVDTTNTDENSIIRIDPIDPSYLSLVGLDANIEGDKGADDVNSENIVSGGNDETGVPIKQEAVDIERKEDINEDGGDSSEQFVTPSRSSEPGTSYESPMIKLEELQEPDIDMDISKYTGSQDLSGFDIPIASGSGMGSTGRFSPKEPDTLSKLLQNEQQGKTLKQLWTEQDVINYKQRFQCVFCQKYFAENWQLKRHMRTHTGEKPFACYFCEYRCARKDSLKSHLTKHQAELKLHFEQSKDVKPFESKSGEPTGGNKPTEQQHQTT